MQDKVGNSDEAAEAERVVVYQSEKLVEILGVRQ